MSKENILELLSIIRTSYPRFYINITKKDAEVTAKLWETMFKDDPYELVKNAILSLIVSMEYPPTIADIKKAMYKLKKNETDSAIDEWNAIKKALSNSAYNSKEMFDKLPSIAQKFVGSPNQLKDWALTPDLNDGVLRGQFLKQYDILKEREQYNALMPSNVRLFISDLANKKMIGGV